MRSSIVPGALSALALVAAQTQNFTIDPSSVPVGTRSKLAVLLLRLYQSWETSELAG